MEKLEKILKDIKPGVDFKNETDLIANGILTSFDLVTLFGILSNEFNINLGITDFIPENFKSIDTIYKMIESKKEN